MGIMPVSMISHVPARVSRRLHADVERMAEEWREMTITGVITAIIIGLIIGALGRLVVPGKQNIPIWLTLVVGIVAAFLGTALARAMGVPTDTEGIDWMELVVQVIVAAAGGALGARLYRRGRPPLVR